MVPIASLVAASRRRLLLALLALALAVGAAIGPAATVGAAIGGDGDAGNDFVSATGGTAIAD